MAKPTRIIYIIFSTLIFVYAVYLSFFSRAEFPQHMYTSSHMPFLSDKPVGEDGYYMLTIAWNLADGKGVVANEGESVTGIQPLGMLVFSGLAKAIQVGRGTKWDFVRAIILFGAINLVVFAFLIGQISSLISKKDKNLGFSIGISLVLLNFRLFRSFTYGLETGLYLTSLAGAMLFTLKRLPSQSRIDVVILGFLGGLCAWSRIDFGVVFFFLLVTMLLFHAITIRQSLIAGIVASLVIAPWFLWVYVQSGTFIPSSGAAQSELITIASAPNRVEAMAKVLIEHLTPWSYSSRLLVLGMTTLAILTALLFYRKVNVTASVLPSKIYMSWGIAFAALVPVYISLFWAKHFYGRYTSPLVCVLLPILAVILTALSSSFERKQIFAAVFLLAMTLSFSGFSYISLHNGKTENSHSVSAGFINQQFDQTTRIGAFQSGVIGYYNENVINLDGKINSRSLAALKSGEIVKYIDNAQISVIVDWPKYIYRNLPEQWLSDWEKCVQQPANPSLCLIRKTHE